MFTIGLAIAFGLIIIGSAWVANKYNKPAIPILITILSIAAMWVYLHVWLFALMGVLLWIAVTLFYGATKKLTKVIFGLLVLVIFLAGLWFTTPLHTYEFSFVSWFSVEKADKPVAEACTPAKNLELTTDGMVVNNIDDGDNSMGTIIWITRDTPTKEPVLFLVPAGASVDIEYQGEMYFVTDRFSGTLAEGACLAEQLHKNANSQLVVAPGSEEIPAGWKNRDSVDGWWSSSAWLYKEANIEPRGLKASDGIFISVDQKNRDIVTKEGEVVYGQFWQPPYDGIVTHIQVRSNQKQSIPLGYEGTYWIWSGDFKLGETDLQKRMLQATFHEVVDRDDIVSVTLLSCGTLPPELDKSVYTLYTGETQFGDVTWTSGLENWACKSMPIK